MSNEILDLKPDDLPDPFGLPGQAAGTKGQMQSGLNPYEPASDGLFAEIPNSADGLSIPNAAPESIPSSLLSDPFASLPSGNMSDSEQSPALFSIPNNHIGETASPPPESKEPPVGHMQTTPGEDTVSKFPETNRGYATTGNDESPNEITASKSGTTWSDSDYPYAPKPRRGKLKAYRDKSAQRLQIFGLRKNILKISNRCVLCGKRSFLAFCRDCLDKMFCCVCNEPLSDGKCINIGCFMGRNNVCVECGNLKPCACDAY